MYTKIVWKKSPNASVREVSDLVFFSKTACDNRPKYVIEEVVSRYKGSKTTPARFYNLYVKGEFYGVEQTKERAKRRAQIIEDTEQSTNPLLTDFDKAMARQEENNENNENSETQEDSNDAE